MSSTKNFKETAKNLGLDDEEVNAAFLKLSASGLAPDDPEAIRVILDVSLEKSVGRIHKELVGAVRHAEKTVKDTADRYRHNITLSLQESHAKIASELTSELVSSVNDAVIKRDENRATLNGVFIAILLAFAFIVGFYVGKVFNINAGNTTTWPGYSYLSSFNPYQVFFAGFIAFIVLRFAVAGFLYPNPIRRLLVLPPRKDHI